jgi:hypothetical protein
MMRQVKVLVVHLSDCVTCALRSAAWPLSLGTIRQYL